jgi:hypothetical protein
MRRKCQPTKGREEAEEDALVEEGRLDLDNLSLRKDDERLAIDHVGLPPTEHDSLEDDLPGKRRSVMNVAGRKETRKAWDAH